MLVKLGAHSRVLIVVENFNCLAVLRPAILANFHELRALLIDLFLSIFNGLPKVQGLHGNYLTVLRLTQDLLTAHVGWGQRHLIGISRIDSHLGVVHVTVVPFENVTQFGLEVDHVLECGSFLSRRLQLANEVSIFMQVVKVI